METLPKPVQALIKADSRLAEYAEHYLEGIPLRVLEMRIKGALGGDAARAFSAAFQSAAQEEAPAEELQGTLCQRHGRLAAASWPSARLATRAEDLARPGYESSVAHEFLDTEAVLQAKVALFAQLVRRARRFVIYAGAGLSTASGIGDYATNTGVASVVAQEKGPAAGFISPYSLKPNLGHTMIAALAEAGFIWRIVQQNHDALLQKAGVPQGLINEIHGCWFDPSNPVVKMDEALREDLFADLCRVEEEVDLVLVLGSSLSGMNADCIVEACSQRAMEAEQAASQLGSVIVSLQRTPYDEKSFLRVFATIDAFARLLIEELSLVSVPVAVDNLAARSPEEDVYHVPYDAEGRLIEEACAQRSPLDLRCGASLRVTLGPDAGQRAEVVGKHPEGHFKLNVHRAEAAGGTKRVIFLGRWWVEAALAGRVPRLPLVSQGAA